MSRTGQESVALMENVLREFMRPINLALIVFMGTFYTANAGVVQIKHRRFAGWGKDV